VQQARILVDAATDPQFLHDAYIVSRRPKSVLCTPLVFRGRVVSVLYLENNLSKGVFSTTRLTALRLVASQAVISIENARLYAQLAKNNRLLEAKVSLIVCCLHVQLVFLLPGHSSNKGTSSGQSSQVPLHSHYEP
jgi:GAF domain-containing protein